MLFETLAAEVWHCTSACSSCAKRWDEIVIFSKPGGQQTILISSKWDKPALDLSETE